MSDTPAPVGPGAAPPPARRRPPRWAVLLILLLLVGGATAWLVHRRTAHRGAVIVFRVAPQPQLVVEAAPKGGMPQGAMLRPRLLLIQPPRQDQPPDIRSRPVLDRAVANLQGQDVPLVQSHPDPAGWLADHLGVDSKLGPESVRVCLEGDPDQAVAVLNALAAAFLAEADRAGDQRRVIVFEPAYAYRR